VEGLEVFETFTPDFYYEMSDDLIFYDLDKDLFYNPSLKEIADINLRNLPGNLCLYSYEELLRIDKLAKEREFNDEEEEPVFFNFDVTLLLFIIKFIFPSFGSFLKFGENINIAITNISSSNTISIFFHDFLINSIITYIPF